ncbi:MAG: fructose-6-phosphate aldolase [Candidatus Lernaella stagnicola]|nr:fructose-6-phosphate aldolase [Candidatus Lernaella stagnicola]
MKFFLDTADIEEIRQGIAMGLVDGVTTNPSLAAKTGKTFDEVAKEICALVKGPVSLEVISSDFEGMIAEARELIKYGDQVVVKIPMTAEGMKAVSALKKEGIRTNVTLVFSSMQALMAAKAGAAYVSPFVGRLDDISSAGMSLIETIKVIFDNYGFDTEILVASVRSPMHVVESAVMGADVATIPFKVLQQMFTHPLTDIGIERFEADYAKIPKR